jgi:lipopolysaccharide/colanic/teichoic acid biosynthesis glycosyltransferase
MNIETVEQQGLTEELSVVHNDCQVFTEYDIKDKKIYIVPKIDKTPSKFVYRTIKRLFDFSASLLAIIILIIPMIIIAIAIRLDSKGPIIYRQARLGLNGKPFTLYKFRSMKQDAEKNGAKWADTHDMRVTKVGLFLRNHRLDEFPQFLNILFGQMSLVGPRPEREMFYDEFEQYIIGFSQRLKVIPGLTGLAQISGGYDLRPEEKILFDIEYIKTRSLWLDLIIMFKTALIVFNRNGAR